MTTAILVTSAAGTGTGTNLRNTFVGGAGRNYALTFQRYALHDQILIEQHGTILVVHDDAITLSDNMIREFTAARSLGDVETLADLIEKEHGRELTDDGFLSDLEVTSTTYGRTLNDLEPLSDAIIAARGFLRTLSDTLDISDAGGLRAYFIIELFRFLNDKLGLSDEAARRVVNHLARDISETPMWKTGPSPRSW